MLRKARKERKRPRDLQGGRVGTQKRKDETLGGVYIAMKKKAVDYLKVKGGKSEGMDKGSKRIFLKYGLDRSLEGGRGHSKVNRAKAGKGTWGIRGSPRFEFESVRKLENQQANVRLRRKKNVKRQSTADLNNTTY